MPDYELLFDYNPDVSESSPLAGAEGADERSGYKIWAVLLHPRAAAPSDWPHPTLTTSR